MTKSVHHTTLKLGKLPARKGAIKFKLSNYIAKSALPTPPKTFGHQGLVYGAGWLMLGNDQYGDCVWAGAGHETMLWNAMAGNTVLFNDSAVLADYAAVTGFNPHKPDTDQGTDMAAAASYRRKTGVVDAMGHRHLIGAYLEVDPHDIDQLKAAMYVFGAVGIGIEFPSSAMDQFNAGKPWSTVSKSKIEGGHYIPGVGFDGTDFLVVTWGKLQRVTPGFLNKYVDEAVVYISTEMLVRGKTPEGFDLAALQADLASLKAA